MTLEEVVLQFKTAVKHFSIIKGFPMQQDVECMYEKINKSLADIDRTNNPGTCDMLYLAYLPAEYHAVTG